MKDIPIESLIEDFIDYRGKTPPKTHSGIRLITAKVVKDGFIQKGKDEYISEETYDDWITRGIPRKGDVLVTTEAPLGEVALLRTDETIALAQRIILLRPDITRVDPMYFFYALRSPIVQARLQAKSTGTTVHGIRQGELLSVEIPIPSRKIQEHVAHVLSSIEKLILGNRRRIEILEEIARAIYREWFVHFRFLGHEDVKMVDSELGGIPEGWEITSVGNAFDLVIGGTPSKKNPAYWEEGHINWHRPSEITKAESMFIDESEMKITSLGMKKSSAKLVPERSVIMTAIGTIGAVAINATPATTNQNCITCVPNEKISPYHLYFWVRENATKIDTMASGAAYKIVTKTVMKDIEFLLPPQTLERQFEKIGKEIADIVLVLLRTNNVLSNARDSLLPKLVSGQIDVSNLKIEVPTDNHHTSRRSEQSTLDR